MESGKGEARLQRPGVLHQSQPFCQSETALGAGAWAGAPTALSPGNGESLHVKISLTEASTPALEKFLLCCLPDSALQCATVPHTHQQRQLCLQYASLRPWAWLPWQRLDLRSPAWNSKGFPRDTPTPSLKPPGSPKTVAGGDRSTFLS